MTLRTTAAHAVLSKALASPTQTATYTAVALVAALDAIEREAAQQEREWLRAKVMRLPSGLRTRDDVLALLADPKGTDR